MSSTSPDRPASTPVPIPDSAAEPTPEAAPETPADHLLIDPTRVRRAPRYPVFLTIGAIVGILGGLWLGRFLVSASDPTGTGAALLKPGVFVSVTVLATTTFAMLLAGLVAVLLDKRSVRRSQRR